MNCLVGGPLLVGGLGVGPGPPAPLNPALGGGRRCCIGQIEMAASCCLMYSDAREELSMSCSEFSQ